MNCRRQSPAWKPLALVLLALLSWVAAAASPAELAAQIEHLRQQHGVAATALVLVNREQLLLNQAFGVSDWQSGKPVNSETRFRVGSVTKAFTGLALLRAQRAGLLRLDAPLATLVGQRSYHNPWEATRPLTLAMLMEHTAGWPDMGKAEFDSADPKPLTLPEALAVAPASRTSLWPPGMYSEYSNSGPGLAAYVLQQRAKLPFEDTMAREVFAPLGMASASLLADPETLAHLAQGYDADGRTPIPYWHVLYRAAAGLNVNPRDMAPFLRMLLNKGAVDGGKAFLHPEDIARAEHPATTLAARHGMDFGYGLGIRAAQNKGHTIYGHGGDADGYLAQFRYSRESGRGYFVVITAFNNEAIEAMQEPLDDWLVEGLPQDEAPPAVTLSAAKLRALAGDYQPATSRFGGDRSERLRVRVKDGQLSTAEPGEAPTALFVVDTKSEKFRRPWETVATTIFVHETDGSVILQGALGNWRKPASSASDP